MDPVSQAVFGTAASSSFSKKTNFKLAFICGLIGGTAADLDVFIKSNTDPLLGLEFHRHFTHSLFFVPFGALLVAAFIYLFRRKNFKEIYFFSAIAYATHGLLDSATSYGTLWLWPFYNERIAFDIIAIIDPFFTLPILILLLIALFKKSQNYALLAFCWSILYLNIGFIQHARVRTEIMAHAEKQQHKIEKIKLNPTIGNLWLWRAVYLSDDTYHINAFYRPFIGAAKLYPGEKLQQINYASLVEKWPEDSILRHDLERFKHFSQDFIYYYPGAENLIADLRYSLLPNGNESLWGVEFDPNKPEQHVNYRFLRNFDNERISKFKLMLLGRDLE